ncbi:hypothetical protein DFJ74DRAFT_295790 [Hyaloraphidium curvatum]|nr:hypothetical protein DFJ74DRAFT_295790 [Hyaloraphidium curvatum]
MPSPAMRSLAAKGGVPSAQLAALSKAASLAQGASRGTTAFRRVVRTMARLLAGRWCVLTTVGGGIGRRAAWMRPGSESRWPMSSPQNTAPSGMSRASRPGATAGARRPPRDRSAACWPCRLRRLRCPRDGDVCGRCRSYKFPCVWPRSHRGACGPAALTAPTAAAYLRSAEAQGISLSVEKTACVRCRASRRGCDGDRRGCGRCTAAGVPCEYPPDKKPRAKRASDDGSASSDPCDDTHLIGDFDDEPSAPSFSGDGDWASASAGAYGPPSFAGLAPSSFPRAVRLPSSISAPANPLDDQCDDSSTLIPDFFPPATTPIDGSGDLLAGPWVDEDPVLPWIRALMGPPVPPACEPWNLEVYPDPDPVQGLAEGILWDVLGGRLHEGPCSTL